MRIYERPSKPFIYGKAMKKKGSRRDTTKATDTRKQNAEQFLMDVLWECFEKHLNHSDGFNPRTNQPYFSDIAEELTKNKVHTPTGKKEWSANSVKNYWRRYIEIKKKDSM
jgi:hypothetical protein